MTTTITTSIAAFVSVLGTTGIAQWYKSAQANYTKNQVHTIVCIIAGAITIIWSVAMNNPSFLAWLEGAIVLATTSIGTYELIFSKISSTLDEPMVPVSSTTTS